MWLTALKEKINYISMTQEITNLSVDSLKTGLFKTQYKNLINYMEADEKRAQKFLGAVVYCFQSVKWLSDCSQESIIASFMKCAELELFPSNVTGQAYVLPYKGIAQFQLGYQGLVTLFYRSGAKSIRAEIVYENDFFEYENGVIKHKPDPFASKEKRGKAKWAYVIVDLPTGWAVAKVMGREDILAIGKKFSKSYDSNYSPWNESNDPELWMWKKTCLKQVAKLVPKNERLLKAIDYDNVEDTDFDEMRKNDLLEKANRQSEASVADLLLTTPKQEEKQDASI